MRLAVSIQMLCDFLQTSSHHSETLHDSQIQIPGHDPTEPLSSQQTNVLSSTSSQEDLIFSPSQNSEVDEASEGENGDEQNEIGAGAINIASSIVRCCLTQLGKFFANQIIIFLSFHACLKLLLFLKY